MNTFQIEFQLMMDTLSSQGWAVLHGCNLELTEVTPQREALSELGLLTCKGSGAEPTARGWRILAGWWEAREGEDEAPGPLCYKSSFAESASYMATGRYRILAGTKALKKILK